MKSCPTCNRTYPDDTLAFCLMDGSVLSAPYDPAERRAPPMRSSEPPPTEVIRSPTPPAETRAPLKSTMRAPAPAVPSLHAARPPVSPVENAKAKNPIFRWAVGARGMVAIVCSVSLLILSVSGQMYYIIDWALYPLLGGALTVVAGIIAYLGYRTGKILVIDGTVAAVAGVTLIFLLIAEWFWVAEHLAYGWLVLTGILQITAAIELRRQVKRSWLIALGGVMSTLLGLAFYGLVFVGLRLSLFFGFRYFRPLSIILPILIGITLALFALLARRRNALPPG